MIYQFISALFFQFTTVEAVELPQNGFQVTPVRGENSAFVCDVSGNVSVIGNRITFPVKMAPPPGQLTSKMVEPVELLPASGEAMRGDDGDSRAYQPTSKERDGNSGPINGGGWIWHGVDVLFVLKMWGIALLVNAVGWPIAMWLGRYWHNYLMVNKFVGYASSVMADSSVKYQRMSSLMRVAFDSDERDMQSIC